VLRFFNGLLVVVLIHRVPRSLDDAGGSITSRPCVRRVLDRGIRFTNSCLFLSQVSNVIKSGFFRLRKPYSGRYGDAGYCSGGRVCRRLHRAWALERRQDADPVIRGLL
jgi:hypothetical protein